MARHRLTISIVRLINSVWVQPWYAARPRSGLALFAVLLSLVWLANIPGGRAAQRLQEGHAVATRNGAERSPAQDTVDVLSAAGERLAKAHPVEAKSTSAQDSANSGSGPKAQAKQKKNERVPKGNANINQLLRLWGVFGSGVRSSCAALHVGKLRCLAGHGDFAVLKRYNRPALLTLQHGLHRQTVLLSAIDGKRVTLVGGDGDTSQISQAKLLRLWTGHFQIIWRARFHTSVLKPGMVGDAVVWLRHRLAQADGKDPDIKLRPQSLVYDGALKAQVKHFQRAHGLQPNGLAGPRTQILLNAIVPSPGAPSLKASQKKQG